jgi:galactitol PTS transporter
MLIERKFSDIFDDDKIEDTFESREDGEKNIGYEIKKSIIAENINLQISIAYNIFSEQNMKERNTTIDNKLLFEDFSFSLEPVKSISEDEQISIYRKFFDSMILIRKADGSIVQLIGRSKKAKEYFCELLKKGKIDKDVLRYVFADDSGKISEFEASKNIKYNTPYEFIADCQSKADISQNRFLSTVTDYGDHPLRSENMGFLTRFNINYLEKDENMVALSEKVDKLFFVEYDLFKHCLVTWKKV